MIGEGIESSAVQSALQPRPALTMVGSRSGLSLEDYACFAGVSSQVKALKDFINAQVHQPGPVLLLGEPGLCQEQIARVIHQASDRWSQPFFCVNTDGLDSEALHSLLFGNRGMIESCSRGTVFLNDLIGLPALLQQRFAAYIEEQRWRAHSSRTKHGGGPRLILATEYNLAEMRSDNRVGFGLVEMLRASSFSLLPLRERSEDLPYLIRHLLAKLVRKLNKGPHEVTPGAMKMLCDYSWQGNIEELEAALESAIDRTPPRQLDESLFPARIRFASYHEIPASGVDLPNLVDNFERNLIDMALRQTNGNQTKAAALLGLRVQTLNMKLKRNGAHRE